MSLVPFSFVIFFFFNDTATTEIYTLSLHDALPIFAAPAVAMMACHFSFNLIDSIWVGRLLGPAALAAVSTAGFYVWVLLSLGEMVEVGLIAVAARRHGEGFPEAAARAAAAAVQYALLAGAVVSIAGFALTDWLFRAMTVPAEVARLGHQYLRTWLLGGPCPPSSGSERHSRSPACCSPGSTCGSRVSRRASGPLRSRRSG